MNNKFKNKKISLEERSWKNYQTRAKKTAVKDNMITKVFKYIILIFFLLTVYQIIGDSGEALYYYEQINSKTEKKNIPYSFSSLLSEPVSDKKEIQALLDSRTFINLKDKLLEVNTDTQHFLVDTTINIPLQHFLLENLDRATSRYIGIVVMEPYSGKILSMVGFDKRDPYHNPCIDSIFPAASVFKIITAAAAIERCGFDADSEIEFFGRKHTLYRSQLENETKRKTFKITLRDSFAQSINPVFGKLGIHYLGKMTLEEYAEFFGFNQNIAFELPLSPSAFYLSDESNLPSEPGDFSLSDDSYHLAEIASGFNRETTISPLHGALMASAILNNGKLTEPAIVEQITDDKGNLFYKSGMKVLHQAISEETSKVMYDLMKATIQSGTCRKTFKDYQNDPILSKLYIGGKTGSINSRTRENYHYDWFVGFAEQKEGTEKIVISVCVAHEKYIGKRANQYAKMIIKEYFGKDIRDNGKEVNSEEKTDIQQSTVFNSVINPNGFKNP